MKSYKILICALLFSSISFAQINSFILDEAEKTIASNHHWLFNRAHLAFENELYLEEIGRAHV